MTWGPAGHRQGGTLSERLVELVLTPLSWRGTLAIAAAVVVPPTLINVIVRSQGTALTWPALLGPLTLGIAVVLTQVRPGLGSLVLAVGILTTIGDAFLTDLGDSALVMVAALPIYLGVSWVTCAVGSRMPGLPGTAWLVLLVGVVVWRLGFDQVPLLLLPIGWFVVGVVLRSRAALEQRLRSRADEITAEQTRYALEAVRLERAVIARELHDVVAHCMTVIVIQAQAGQQLVARDPAAAAEALEAITASAAEAEHDISALVVLVDPQRPRPLTRSLLDDLVRRSVATGTRVSLVVDGDLDRLAPGVAVAAHRVVQEGLTNAFRHAPGGDVAIEASCGSAFTMSVVNESTSGPAPLSGSGTGRGLDGLRERLAVLGGTVTWGPTADGRWRVAMTAPMVRAEVRAEVRPPGRSPSNRTHVIVGFPGGNRPEPTIT